MRNLSPLKRLSESAPRRKKTGANGNTGTITTDARGRRNAIEAQTNTNTETETERGMTARIAMERGISAETTGPDMTIQMQPRMSIVINAPAIRETKERMNPGIDTGTTGTDQESDQERERMMDMRSAGPRTSRI